MEAKTQVAKSDLADKFQRLYYAEVDPEELASREPRDLKGAAAAHLAFGRKFATGKAKLRAYNPVREQDGWQSTHTVIEIVNDDMPFLVDSVTMEVNRQGLTLHLLIHPVLRVVRDSKTELQSVAAPSESREGRLESFMHVEVDRQTDPAKLTELEAGIAKVLADVRAAVEDWRPMQARMSETVRRLESAPPGLPQAELEESRAFLAWLLDHHFTFLGCRDYALETVNREDVLRIVPGTGLGILRERGETLSASFATLPPEARKRARVKELLVITKANARSTVHRPGHLDYVGVKHFNAKGEVTGETRFLGLYTHTVYSENPMQVPLLRRKLNDVIERAELLPAGYSGKALASILESYPRDELMQISAEDLYRHAMAILQLGERQRLRLLVRQDAYARFVSCLIFVPRERYNTELRIRFQRILTEAFNGVSSEFDVDLSASTLGRILMRIRTRPGEMAGTPEVKALERRLVAAMRRWEDDLHAALLELHGEERANQLFRVYGNAFPASYREEYTVHDAVSDIEMIESLDPKTDLGMNLHVSATAEPGTLRFKIYRRGSRVPLSDSLPMLERLGVRVLFEHPHKVEPAGAAPVWVVDFGLVPPAAALALEQVRESFHEAFFGMWSGTVESDQLNRLVLTAELTPREISVLRAYARYLNQTGSALSLSYVEQALAGNPRIAALLVRLFFARFKNEAASEANRVTEIAAALDEVENLDEDRILRSFLAVMQATTRTNYFLHKPYLSFKLDPKRVPGLPEPRPMFEIWVYSPRIEGVHLRGGRVARGGLRWSDRREDFRTEVLGLMKAQMVKNVVIVPVGAKGGFVLKRAPAGDREALMKEGVACYQTFLRGMLDVTDNLVGGKVVPPRDVVRHDRDDPYLVVAADKGTATFSDYANAIAQEYGFWLGDAFASGGSAGYDHKKMAITARGAWESVKRHFRELGVDTQSQDFTVAGIGDMSGDVFGNGMLLSRHIRLVAAFDHRHIFLDPAPDAEKSFEERQRLFNLTRSSWADYEAKLISKGGGVFPRSAKSISLSPEVQKALGIDAKALPPNELISAILKAPVDLLYNGGIGTYVKASKQSHSDVGDRANDAIRVNDAELRCKVVAEGGNLGFTQLGRVEYALKGGRINTDAIDNSAGVSCSDHEVNIKILLNAAERAGKLTVEQRNQLLADMTDEVAALVLRDNYFQTQSLAVSGGALAPSLLDAQERFIKSLEKAGRLNRALEFLPNDEEFAERRAAKLGLTSPERAVLLAYSKIALKEALLDSDVPDDPFISTALERYFPVPLRSRFKAEIHAHPLRREIIATHVTNSMINRVGSTFVHRMQEETGAAAPEVVRAYLIVREVFGFVELWRANEALDYKVPDRVQSAMIIDGGRLIVRGTLWFLRNRAHLGDLTRSIEHFQAGARRVAALLPQILPASEQAAFAAAARRLEKDGVPKELAASAAGFDAMFSALDIVEVADSLKRDIETVARAHFALAGELDFPWLRESIGMLVTDTHWQTLAKAALRDDLATTLRALTADALRADASPSDPSALISAWKTRNSVLYERFRQILADLRAAESPDLAMLSVAMRELRNLSSR
jgi:glutamate dehydrogenase